MKFKDFGASVLNKLQAQTGFSGPSQASAVKQDKEDNEKKSSKTTRVRRANTSIKLNKVANGTQYKTAQGDTYTYTSNLDVWVSSDPNKENLSRQDGAKQYNSTSPQQRVTFLESMKNLQENTMILKEGGNVFKTEPDKKLIASRIATVDVKPTIDWLNKTFGFKFTPKEFLGTTGTKTHPDGTFEKNSSGDLDLNTDTRELPKEEIIAKLSAWCQKQGIPDLEIMNKGRTFEAGWIKDAGSQVHFRTPIKGDPKNGFVQTDFMLTDNPALQRGAKRGGTENYTGADRAVLLSSIARGRGYKFSPTKGIVDPNNGDAVVADDWDEIAEVLLGKGAREADTHTVEQMLAKLKSDPNYEELIAPWKENMEKQGKTVPESVELTRIKELSGLTLNSVRML